MLNRMSQISNSANSKKENLEKKFNRIGDRPLMFEMEEVEAQDIDVELNFKVAEFLFKELYPGK